jgi:N6-adenosine-specific RNA methylase IME4
MPDTVEIIDVGRAETLLPGTRTVVALMLPPDLSLGQWQDVGEKLARIAHAAMWWLGDWVRYGETRAAWGQMYEKIIEETGKGYQTCANAKWVADAFADVSRRREKLSWGHHAEVAGLVPAEADSYLDRAERERWSVRELRRHVQRRTNPIPEAGIDLSGRIADLERLIARGARFGTIYADPPWLYDNQGTRASTSNHYEGLTVEQLCELPVAKLAADDAHVHLWVTIAFLFDAPRIFAAWGFQYRSMFVWAKTQLGLGNYWRNSHELLLTGIRGDAKRFNDKNLRSWHEYPRGKHSAKPEQVRNFLERASPGPRLELFARAEAPGWVVWGNEVETRLTDHGELAPAARGSHLETVDCDTNALLDVHEGVPPICSRTEHDHGEV